MSNPVGGNPLTVGGGVTVDADGAIAQMEAAFNRAIAKSAEITAITTEKKVELDASKQRPNV